MKLQRYKSMRAGPALLALAMTIALTVDLPSSASDASAERARLTAVLRQLDVLERMTQHDTEVFIVDGRRYHFDYPRLHSDIERIRAGIRDYLSPLRAQPRDVQELTGNYRLDEDTTP